MMEIRELRCTGPAGGHIMRYADWGDRSSERAVVCVHGVARNGRDFDAFAEALVPGCRVLCPDLVGRGRSDWLTPKSGYVRETYLADLTALFECVEGRDITYVGSSMGGMLGMRLAARPDTPIRRLVLVDVGPLVRGDAAPRLARALAMDLTFSTIEELEGCLRMYLRDMGQLDDASWRHLAVHSARAVPDGFKLAHDPGIAEPFRTSPADNVDLWDLWDRIACPVMVIRGERSAHLPPDVLAEMQRRGPPVDVVVLPGCGHPPHLMTEPHIAPVRGWLHREWGHAAAAELAV